MDQKLLYLRMNADLAPIDMSVVRNDTQEIFQLIQINLENADTYR